MIPHARAGNTGGSHAEGGLLASQHAPGREQSKDSQKSQEPTTAQDNEAITPEQVAIDLKAIIKGLEDEGIESSWIAAAHRLAARAERAARAKKPKQTIELVSERLGSIEKILMARQPTSQAAERKTWATIAANNTRQASEPKAANLTRYIVRITIVKVDGISN